MPDFKDEKITHKMESRFGFDSIPHEPQGEVMVEATSVATFDLWFSYSV